MSPSSPATAELTPLQREDSLQRCRHTENTVLVPLDGSSAAEDRCRPPPPWSGVSAGRCAVCRGSLLIVPAWSAPETGEELDHPDYPRVS